MLDLAKNEDQLTHASSHILRAWIIEGRPLRVRRSRVLAQIGELDLWREGDETEAEMRQAATDRDRDKEKGKSLLHSLFRRKVRPIAEGGILAKGDLHLHRATGEGEIFLGHKGGDVSVFDLADESLFVFTPREVLAHDDSLVAELSNRIDPKLGAVLGSTKAWTLTGAGQFATATNGEVVVVSVEPERPVIIEVEAVAAATTGISYETPDDYRRRVAERGLAAALKYSPHLPQNIDVGRRRVWAVATGTGQMIVRSSD